VPGLLLRHERLAITQYQTVMNLNPDGNRSREGSTSHAFAPICQYLSSIVREMEPSISSPETMVTKVALPKFE
jgi:hypothetical protein